jgi:hypothetical protein
MLPTPITSALLALLEAHRHLRTLQGEDPMQTVYAPPRGLWPPRWLRIVGFAREKLPPVEAATYRAACHYLALQAFTARFNAAAHTLRRWRAWNEVLSNGGVAAVWDCVPFVGPKCKCARAVGTPRAR